jgi:acyl-CoA synthetase (AMP-forming)/AMP-acid ligase II
LKLTPPRLIPSPVPGKEGIHLGHEAVPGYVRIVDGLPITVAGGVRKVEMREIAAAGPAG